MVVANRIGLVSTSTMVVVTLLLVILTKGELFADLLVFQLLPIALCIYAGIRGARWWLLPPVIFVGSVIFLHGSGV